MSQLIDPRQTRWDVAQPLETHFREAACKEVDCPHWLMGWRTIIDERTQFGQRQAGYIRHQSGRSFSEEVNEAELTIFTFPAGQKCFRQHKMPLDRPALFKKNGLEMEGEDWIDDNKETLYKLNQLRNRG